MAISQIDAGAINGSVQDADITGMDVTAASQLIIAGISIDSSGDTTPSGAWDPAGVNEALGSFIEDATTGQYGALGYLLNPTAATNKTVRLHHTVGVNFPTNACAVTLAGIHATTPRASTNAVGSSSAASLSSGALTIAAGDWVVSFLALDGSGLSVGQDYTNITVARSTGGTGISTAAGVGSNSFASCAILIVDTAPVDGQTVDCSWANTARCSMVTFVITAAAAVGGTPTGLLTLGVGSVLPIWPAWWRWRRMHGRKAA